MTPQLSHDSMRPVIELLTLIRASILDFMSAELVYFCVLLLKVAVFIVFKR